MGRLALSVLNDVADALGYPQLTTIEGTLDPQHRKLLRALNRVIRTLSAMDDWYFLRREGNITTVAEYTTGTATVTNGSAAVVGTDDAGTPAADPPVWTIAMEGRAISFGADAMTYRILQVTSPTALTLDRTYEGTGGSQVQFTIAQDRYELAEDFDRPIGDWTNFFGSSTTRMVPVSPDEFLERRRRRTVGVSTGEPTVFTPWGLDDETEHRLVILDPWPKERRVLLYPYQRTHPEMVLDTDKLLFPLRQEPAIIDAVIYLMKRDIEDDLQAGNMLVEYLQGINNIMSKREYGSEQRRMTPAHLHRKRQYYKWASRGGRIDYGDLFDLGYFYDLRRYGGRF